VLTLVGRHFSWISNNLFYFIYKTCPSLVHVFTHDNARSCRSVITGVRVRMQVCQCRPRPLTMLDHAGLSSLLTGVTVGRQYSMGHLFLWRDPGSGGPLARAMPSLSGRIPFLFSTCCTVIRQASQSLQYLTILVVC
jgi:hypothetical protein